MVVPEMSGSEGLKSLQCYAVIRKLSSFSEALLGVKLIGDDYESYDSAFVLELEMA